MLYISFVISFVTSWFSSSWNHGKTFLSKRIGAMVTFCSSGVLYNVKNFSVLYNQVIASSTMNRVKFIFIERGWETIEVKGWTRESLRDFRNSWCNPYWSIFSNRWSICINQSWCKPRVSEMHFSCPCISFILVLSAMNNSMKAPMIRSVSKIKRKYQQRVCVQYCSYILWNKPVSITTTKK